MPVIDLNGKEKCPSCVYHLKCEREEGIVYCSNYLRAVTWCDLPATGEEPCMDGKPAPDGPVARCGADDGSPHGQHLAVLCPWGHCRSPGCPRHCVEGVEPGYELGFRTLEECGPANGDWNGRCAYSRMPWGICPHGPLARKL